MSNFNNVMVIEVEVSKYEGSKVDRSAGKQLDDEKNVRGKGYRATKPACDAEEMSAYLEPYKEFKKWLGDLTNCLPLGNGRYMFSVEKYQEAVQKADDFKTKFVNGYTTFCENFPEIVEKQKLRLNDAWDINDYPKNIWNNFGVRIHFGTLPDSGALRKIVGLPQEDVDRLVKSNEEAVMGMVETAIKAPYRRIIEVVSHMAETLSNEGAKFKDSLVNNIKELADTLPAMNITKSKELDDIAERLSNELCAVQPNLLRYDLPTRKETVEKAERILADLEGYF
jgi:hypothetical protein